MSYILQQLSPDEVDNADSIAQEFVKSFVGRSTAEILLAMAIINEFCIRHDVYEGEDLHEATLTVKDFRDEKGEVGRATLQAKSKGVN